MCSTLLDCSISRALCLYPKQNTVKQHLPKDGNVFLFFYKCMQSVLMYIYTSLLSLQGEKVRLIDVVFDPQTELDTINVHFNWRLGQNYFLFKAWFWTNAFTVQLKIIYDIKQTKKVYIIASVFVTVNTSDRCFLFSNMLGDAWAIVI
jgi:hypothetical protein